MSDILDPLPEVVYCSRLGCIESIRRELLPGGWWLLAGAWFCPDHAEDCCRRFMADIIDGISQEEPEEPDSAVLAVDPEQTQDMPAPEDDP